MLGDQLPLCECGCGQRLLRNKSRRTGRRFIHGHNTRVRRPAYLKQLRETRFEEDLVYIPLTGKGGVAIVDRLDYPLVEPFTWSVTICRRKGENRYSYAITYVYQPPGAKKQTQIRMHRLIMGMPQDSLVDHRNGNTLDNRRSNLRLCTTAENCQNQFARQGGTSRFKGVSFCRQTGRWKARLRKQNVEIWIGRFDSELEAAEAYDESALYHFEQFANPNFGERAEKTARP